MENFIALISRPDVIMLGAALLIILMMLIAIMSRMSRRDAERDQRIDDMRDAMDRRLGDAYARTESRLTETDQFMRASVEHLNDGVARALADAGHTQAGRMDDYAARTRCAAQAESERSRAFDEAMRRRMDEMERRADERMARLRSDIASDTESAIGARLDAALGGLDERLERLGGELERFSRTSGELNGLKDALNWRPRGADGDARLDALLMQWLSPGRYVRHFEVGTGSGRYADFAIMLPDENGQTLYLPVDSSFPADEFAGDWNDDVRHRLSESVNAYARRIASELIKPGLTADFAIMLIQNELVCARVNELDDSMRDAQLARRVIPAGPSAFWAMVRALEGGMNALAMQRRSEELERLLGEVRQELGRFSRMLGTPERAKAVAEQAEHDLPEAELKDEYEPLDYDDDVEDEPKAYAGRHSVPARDSVAHVGGENDIDIWN